MIYTESSYRVNVVSHKDAHGLLQLRTGAIEDVLRYNPIKCARWTIESVQTNWKRNVWAGIWYMNQQFINANGDLKEALRMYNRGPGCSNYVYTYADKVLSNRSKI
jgi:soluble lytic murein transglycosylase-like protein